MLSQNNGNERLSEAFLAVIEISKALISKLEFSELLGPAIQKIVSLAEQADIDSKVFWGQSLGMFQA